MKKTPIWILAVTLSLTLALPAWAIEREKKSEPVKSEQKPRISENDKKKPGAPVEIAPPKESRPQESRKPESPVVERKTQAPGPVEREKMKSPPVERKMIGPVDQFIDRNGNGIDDRLEAKEKVVEKPKPKPPTEKKKKD